MPELNLQEKAAQEAAIIYGNKFLRDDFPISDPYTAASLLPQQPQTVLIFKFWTTPDVIQEDQKALISDWPENEDPFTQADLLNNEEDQVQELIFQIRKSLSITYHESLANRLLTLLMMQRKRILPVLVYRSAHFAIFIIFFDYILN